MNKRPRNAKRRGRNPALAADTVAQATVEDYTQYTRKTPQSQPPTIEDLKRKIAYHRQRARRFKRLARLAWVYRDPVNVRKMDRARRLEANLATAARRVLLTIGD